MPPRLWTLALVAQSVGRIVSGSALTLAAKNEKNAAEGR